jgi:hypothetical protein
MNTSICPSAHRGIASLAGVLCFVFVIFAAGCGGSGTGNLAPGVLEGTVSIGPLCPVEPCQISPEQLAAVYAARKVIVYNADRSSVIKELSLDQSGKYMTELPQGQYIVDINHVGIDRSAQVPTTVIIESGKTTTLDISIDTGLR